MVWYSLLSHQLDSSLTHEEGLCQLEPACRALSPDDLENHLSAVDANIHHLAVFSGVALFSPAALFSAKWRRRREVGDGAGRGHHGVGVLVFFLVSVGPGKKKFSWYAQCWLLTQFYSVYFSQSRIGVNKCVFNKRTITVCVSCC